MSVNYDKIGVVVTPPTAATQGDHPGTAVTTADPPDPGGPPTGWRSRATASSKEFGGQDREIQSRINAASQVFRSLKKSVFQPRGLELQTRLLQLPGALTPYESWALTNSQAAQLETFHNSCIRRMMGRYRGTRGSPQLTC